MWTYQNTREMQRNNGTLSVTRCYAHYDRWILCVRTGMSTTHYSPGGFIYIYILCKYITYGSLVERRWHSLQKGFALVFQNKRWFCSIKAYGQRGLWWILVLFVWVTRENVSHFVSLLLSLTPHSLYVFVDSSWVYNIL